MSKPILWALVAVLFVALCGLSLPCTQVAKAEGPPQSHAFQTIAGRPDTQPSATPTTEKSINVSAGTLSLDQAIALTLERNSTLSALAFQAQANRAAALQAGLRPNPTLDVTVDNFGGHNQTRGLDAAETTVALSQAIELGGKRSKRRTQARLAVDVAAWEVIENKVDLIADVQNAFYAVVADQLRLVVAGEQLQLAEQVLATVAARVEVGKVSPLEETRARTALATSRIALANARRGLEVSRGKLVAFWGGRSTGFETTSGELGDAGATAPDLQTLSDAALKHPRIAKRAAVMTHQEAAVELSVAERIPDFTISGGVRHFAQTDETALVAGFSVPLPLFDRNQGAISQSRHQLAAAKADLEATRIDILMRLNQAYQTMLAARAEAQTLAADALPGARAAFDAAREGYQQGKFGYLELLDARKTLSELTLAHIDALGAYQAAAVEVARWSCLNPPLKDIATMAESKQR